METLQQKFVTPLVGLVLARKGKTFHTRQEIDEFVWWLRESREYLLDYMAGVTKENYAIAARWWKIWQIAAYKLAEYEYERVTGTPPDSALYYTRKTFWKDPRFKSFDRIRCKNYQQSSAGKKKHRERMAKWRAENNTGEFKAREAARKREVRRRKFDLDMAAE